MDLSELCNNQATDQLRRNCHSNQSDQVKIRSGSADFVQEVDSEVGEMIYL